MSDAPPVPSIEVTRIELSDSWTATNEALLEECAAHYCKDKIEHAYQARWRLQQQVTAEQWSAVVGRNPWLDDIVTDWDDLNRLLDTIADDDGWTQIANKDGIRGLYRQEPGSRMHSIKVHAIVPAPVLRMVALINEVDLMPSLIKFVKLDARRIAQLSVFAQLAYFRLGLYFPFEDRDMVLHARGVDLLHRGCLAIIGHTAATATAPVPAFASLFPADPCPPAPYRVTRLAPALCGGLVRVAGPHRVVVSVVINVDPQLSFVPVALVNYVTRSLACMGFEMCRTKLAHFVGSVYERRVSEKRWFYDEVASRLDTHGHSRTYNADGHTHHAAAAANNNNSNNANAASSSNNAATDPNSNEDSAVPSPVTAPAAHVTSAAPVAAEEVPSLVIGDCARFAVSQFVQLHDLVTLIAPTTVAVTNNHNNAAARAAARVGHVLWAGPVTVDKARLALVVGTAGAAFAPAHLLPALTALLARAHTLSAQARLAPCAARAAAAEEDDNNAPLGLGITLSGESFPPVPLAALAAELSTALSHHLTIFLPAALVVSAPDNANVSGGDSSLSASGPDAPAARGGGCVAVAVRGDWQPSHALAELAAAGRARSPVRGTGDIELNPDGTPLGGGDASKAATVRVVTVGGSAVYHTLSGSGATQGAVAARRSSAAEGVVRTWKRLQRRAEAPGAAAEAGSDEAWVVSCKIECESAGEASALQWALSGVL